MKVYYDFHIHSCLSPCGDSEMTPNNIVNMAMVCGLHAIALTDHNSCGNCAATARVAAAVGLSFIPGMELCTAEEAHVVCLFPTVESALSFETVVRPTLPPVQNRAAIFGEQILCNADDEVVGTEPLLLTTASSLSVDELPSLTAQFGGICFPAHIDRPSYSVTASLGDVPPLPFAAVEVTPQGDIHALRKRYAVGERPVLINSDAHYLEHIREPQAYLELSDSQPTSILAALRGERLFTFGVDL